VERPQNRANAAKRIGFGSQQLSHAVDESARCRRARGDADGTWGIAGLNDAARACTWLGMNRGGHLRWARALIVGTAVRSLVGCTGLPAETTSRDAGTDARMCSVAISNAAAALVQEALLEAGLSCVNDESCQVVGITTNCSGGCTVLTNSNGEVAVTAAISRANATVCNDFGPLDCIVPTPCPVGYLYGESCVDGGCVGIPPAAWQALVICEGVSSNGVPVDELNPSSPPSCSGSDASTWTVSPNGTIIAMTPIETRTTDLSPADFATIDGILRNVSFREDVLGYMCGLSPNSAQVLFYVRRSGTSVAFNGTGCLLDASANDFPAELLSVVEKY